MNPLQFRINLFRIVLLLTLFLTSCSFWGNKNAEKKQLQPDASFLFPLNLTKAVRKVLPSIIEVAAVLEYRVEEYQYEKRNEQYIPDPESPVGYRLAGGSRKTGIVESRTNTKAYGAGLLIGKNASRFLILTSKHIVVQQDTLTDYIYLNNTLTDIPRTRAFLIRNELGIRGARNVLRPAQLVAADDRMDIALISALQQDVSGREYSARVAVELKPVWGNFGIAIGYPEEIKQIATGLTGEAPYPGNFSLTIHGAFGYSGGPIFLFDPKKGLALVGMGKSVPGKKLFFVTPDSSLRFKTRLNYVDIPHLQTEELAILSPHRIYGIKIQYVLRFIRDSLGLLERQEYRLVPTFFKAIRQTKSDNP